MQNQFPLCSIAVQRSAKGAFEEVDSVHGCLTDAGSGFAYELCIEQVRAMLVNA